MAGDPWGAIATPRLPRRLPKVLEVEQVEALLAVIDATSTGSTPPAADDGLGRGRHDPDLARAIALRDRALVETAYAAGPADQRARGRGPRASTSGAARSASWARGARSGSGCSGGRPARPCAPTSTRPGRSSRAGRPRAARTPTAVFLNHHGGPLGVRGLRGRLDRLRRAAGLPRA